MVFDVPNNFNPQSGSQHINSKPITILFDIAWQLGELRSDIATFRYLSKSQTSFIDSFFDDCTSYLLNHVTKEDLSPLIIYQTICSHIQSNEQQLVKILHAPYINRIASRNGDAFKSIKKGFVKKPPISALLQSYLNAIMLIRNSILFTDYQNMSESIFEFINIYRINEDRWLAQELINAKSFNSFSLIKNSKKLSILETNLPSVDKQSITELSYSVGTGLYAFGHMLNSYEGISRLLALGCSADNICLTIGPSFVANSVLSLIIKHKIETNSEFNIVEVSDSALIRKAASGDDGSVDLSRTATVNGLRALSLDRPTIGYLEAVSISTDQLHLYADQLKIQLDIPSRPFVCLYLRTDHFKNETSDGVHLNSDRNSDPDDYIQIVEELHAMGYDVVRMGDMGQPSMNFTSSAYYEYNKSNCKNDLQDIYYFSQCEFMVVGGLGGAATAASTFGRPTFYADYPLMRRFKYDPYAVYCPQRYTYKGGLITNEELIALSGNGMQNASRMLDHGFMWHNSDRDLVMKSLRKFVACIKSDDYITNATMSFDSIEIVMPLHMQNLHSHSPFPKCDLFSMKVAT